MFGWDLVLGHHYTQFIKIYFYIPIYNFFYKSHNRELLIFYFNIFTKSKN